MMDLVSRDSCRATSTPCSSVASWPWPRPAGRSGRAASGPGGTTRAAAVLHLTQSAVSQQIKRLEEGLGCELFRRDRKRMRLTEAGEGLAPGAPREAPGHPAILAPTAGP